MIEIIIPKPEIENEWKTFCIYSNHHFSELDMNNEHVIPRSLGGNNSTIIKVNSKLNSEIGSKIDAVITNDILIQFSRKTYNAKGASKKTPVPLIKKAAAWSRGESFENLDYRYNLEIRNANEATKIYDTKSGQFVDVDFNQVGFVSEFIINSEVRAKFVAKTFLGMGWGIFGHHFLSIGCLDFLREFIGSKIEKSLPPVMIYYFDPFLIKSEDIKTHPYLEIQKRLEKYKNTTILLREKHGLCEWTVSCLGNVIGTIRIPLERQIAPEYTSDGAGVLIEISTYGLMFYKTDIF